MKKILRLSALVAFMVVSQKSVAQTYTPSQMNWDNLNYYFNSGGNVAPYGYGSSSNYISNTQELTQKFAIGTAYATFVTSAAGIADGDNGTHKGDITGFTGDDVQFTPSTSGQTLTITFNSDVKDVSFALYDIDRSARVDVDAFNVGGTAQSVTITKQASSILTVASGTTANITVGTTSLTSMTDNRGTATVSVTGPIRKIVITFTTLGSDPTLWLSDINASVQGSFPTNYFQSIPNSKPFAGQADYFITTPDNNSAYMVDPATGKAWLLFTESASTYINSFAYDAVNHFLYYVTDGSATSTLQRNNKQLKKYDFTNSSTSVVVADIGTTLGIPTFDQGVESGAAAFYNGALYLGIEGGQYSGTSTRQSIIWKIEFTGTTPSLAYQVWAIDSYAGSNTNHDWGDFIIKDGMIYDFNTARINVGTQSAPIYNYPSSAFHHFNMMTGDMQTYLNPNAANPYVGQGGIDWAGNIYSVRNSIEKYNLDGTMQPAVPITVVGGTWVGNAGDASEPFRPMMDFGDAPATYDPAASDPAVHEIDATTLRLGGAIDKEWVKKTATAAANSDTDDGLPFVTIFNPGYGNYLTSVNVFNNTGANATLCAWLDYNGNGVFDASEGISVTVATNASTQSVYLYWPSTPSSLSSGSATYLRIRVTSAANGMTKNNPTGYFSNGEVEDYRVTVGSFPLAVQKIDFTASAVNHQVALNWSMVDDQSILTYRILRSQDEKNWDLVKEVASANLPQYSAYDSQPIKGKSFYRLQMIYRNGQNLYSQTKVINLDASDLQFIVVTNPVQNLAKLAIYAPKSGAATIRIMDNNGHVISTTAISVKQGNSTELIPVAQIPTGTYIIELQKEETQLRRKIIISK